MNDQAAAMAVHHTLIRGVNPDSKGAYTISKVLNEPGGAPAPYNRFLIVAGVDDEQFVVTVVARKHEASKKCWCEPKVERVHGGHKAIVDA